jgi:hypothetical protein
MKEGAPIIVPSKGMHRTGTKGLLDVRYAPNFKQSTVLRSPVDDRICGESRQDASIWMDSGQTDPKPKSIDVPRVDAFFTDDIAMIQLLACSLFSVLST